MVVAILFIILGFIVIRGISAISWTFISAMPEDGMTKGGIFPAIVGTLCLIAGSIVFAFPIGLMSGIYLNEYLKETPLKRFLRAMTDNLAGIPSIVFGLFGMAFFVNTLEFGDSIFPNFFNRSKTKFFLHKAFDRQTMTIPSKTTRHIKPTHCPVSGHNIF